MGANFVDTYDSVVAKIADTGLHVVTDVRNASVPCVIVDPPSISAGQSATLVQLSFQVTAVAPPPGNRDSLLWLLDAADEIVGVVNVTSGGPGSYTLGQSECPAYSLTVTIQIQRT